MSLRLRLTLLSTATLVLLMLAGTAGLYLTVSRTTYAIVEDALIQDTRRLVSGGWFRPDNIEKPYGRGDGGQGWPSTALFQTRTLDGAVLDRAAALGEAELPLSPDGLAALRAGHAWTERVAMGAAPMLVHSRMLLARGQPVGIIQAARPLDDYERALAVLTTALAAAGAAGTLLAFGSSWLLVGAALRPIDRITQAAAEIGAERDFSRQVDYRGPNDEVGRLAQTVNGMLARLGASYRQIAQALQTQRRFVADASHELRTPLTTVRGNLDLLGREPPIPPEDRAAVLRDTVEETERMMRLVSDLLALARADAGWRPPLAAVPLAPLAEEVARQARLQAPARQIAVAVAPGLEACANRDMLKQVLIILVDNALKHTPPEAGVRLGAGPAGEGVALEVRDEGPGIAPALLPQIFDRFFRADDARSAGGAGLGLSIARALVEAQGGTIGVESREGEGSAFTVRLAAT
jgi:signal transduction histidine kinase